MLMSTVGMVMIHKLYLIIQKYILSLQQYLLIMPRFFMAYFFMDVMKTFHMAKKKIKENKTASPETVKDLKKQVDKKDEVKKGYNEKNPAQPQGAFKPDSLT